MVYKVITIFVLIAVTAAIPIGVPTFAKQIIYADAPAEYSFNYAVNDGHTGDVKSQQETRKGDHVVGQYTLIDADGYQRIVDYQADDHTGFNAVVRREPLGGYKQAPIIRKAIIAAPVAKLVAAPIAPVARYISAPVVTKYVGGGGQQYINNHAQVSFNGPAHSYHY